MDPVFNRLTEKLQETRHFSDTYFSSNPLATSLMKAKQLADRIDDLLSEIETVRDSISKAQYWFMRGLAYGIQSEFISECEECLNRSLKLEPSSYEAWNALGECLWKKNAQDAAKHCFEKALAKERNKTSLRCLSMCLRIHDSSEKSSERIHLLQQSWNLARQAVDLDPTDGKSQYCFANACFALFVASAQRDADLLNQARKAYLLAAANAEAALDPDLQHNMGMFFLLDEDYQISIDAFSKAVQLDPFFSEPKERLERLLCYLTRCEDSVNKKGKQKSKRLSELTKTLCHKRNWVLGPFASGAFVNPNTKEKIPLAFKHFSNLHYGPNSNSVVTGSVAGVVLNDDSIPYTFCLVDEEGTCFAVTVYNFAEHFGVVIGQSVAIAEPYLTSVDVSYQRCFKFNSIRVPTPEVLVVNGKKVGKEYVALLQLTMSSTKDASE